MKLLNSLKVAFEAFKLSQEHGELLVTPASKSDSEKPKDPWVNTSEQLPEAYDSVIVINPDTSIFMDAFIDGDGEWNGYYYAGVNDSEKLRFTPGAWLPIIWREP